jgi:peptidoglycan/xylan/chitin deacetylase (PgdA/CDA1 family)
VSHYNLAAISPACLDRELVDSKATIESQTGTKVVSVAYPFGGREHWSEAVKAAAERAGYEFGLTYMEGINPLASLSRYELRRIHVDRDTDMDLFRALLQWPGLFARR